MKTNSVYAACPHKNLATSLLFSIFLGPLGLLYSSTIGGVTMLCVALVVLSAHYPFPVILMWISCSIWSVMATNKYNHKIMEARLIKNNEEKNNTTGNPSGFN